MTTSPAAALKKELTKTFPGIKFSVKTKSSHIYVEWTLPIGINVTDTAVREICKKHETVVHHGSLIDDTAYSTGYSIWTYPRYSQERKDWAVEATKAHNFVGVTWNEKWQRFDDVGGREAFHATKQYHEYCSNGVSCNLVDEYGREPDAKRWYYERLAKEIQTEAPVTEPEIIKPELIELPQEVVAPVVIEPIAPEAETVPAQAVFKIGDRILHNDKGTATIIWVGKQEIKVENNNDEFFLLKIKSFHKKGWELVETSTSPIAPAEPENNLIPFPSPKHTIGNVTKVAALLNLENSNNQDKINDF